MKLTDALLAKQLGRLQLPYFVEHHPALMVQAARESWPHGRFLEQLVAGEVARRDEALINRRIKAARRNRPTTPPTQSSHAKGTHVHFLERWAHGQTGSEA